LERLRRPDDATAWERFAELYTPLLYHWALRAGLQRADAADLVQDVFLLLIRKLPEFHYDPTKQFRAWLRTVTLNKYRERQRSARRQPGSFDPDSEPAIADPAAEYWENEYRGHLATTALNLLRTEFSATTWTAIWATTVEGRRAADVAAELKMTPGAVLAAKCRALARLRQELDGML
jgi:RNA polymerase sigma-70 factor (ECF subfamily)